MEGRKLEKREHGTLASITANTDGLQEVPYSSLNVRQRKEEKKTGRQNKEKGENEAQ